MPFKVYTEYSMPMNGYSMAIFTDDLGGSRAFVQKLELKSFPEHSFVSPEEAFCLQDQMGNGRVKDFLQAMLDKAWEFGLRPTGVKDHTDELTAVRYHLEDMRKIALSEPVIVNELREAR